MIETMKMALEALENHNGNYKLTKAEAIKHNEAITALNAAIEKAEKAEPVAWAYFSPEGALMYAGSSKTFTGYLGNVYPCVPLYTAPAVPEKAEPVATMFVDRSIRSGRTEVDFSVREPALKLPSGDYSVFIHTAPAMPGWQPIETAPKDFTRVLLCIDHGEGCDKVWTGLWADGWMVSYGKARTEPTHWMPLPAAPEAP